MGKMHGNRFRSPSPSVIEPRRSVLLGAYSFVRAASTYAGLRRISLLGSLVTAKAIPKDVDLLVTIDSTMDLTQLARAGRRLMGSTQSINLGADVFLADVAGRYLGRICYYRECRPRTACRAEHCGLRQHLSLTTIFMSSRCQRICLPHHLLSFGRKLSGASWYRLTSRRPCWPNWSKNGKRSELFAREPRPMAKSVRSPI